MPFELDKNVDLSRAMTVTLGRQELQVAPLTLRKIMALAEMSDTDDIKKLPARAQIDRLLDYVMLGLERTYPTLTREELLEAEITVDQLRAASDVIIVQAGGKKKEAGEPTATSNALSDGTGSSPSSALN
jgi:hypothetical protein